MTPAALALSLLLSTPEQAPARSERTSFPRVLTWVATAKAWDEWSSDYALLHLGKREWNGLNQTPGQRSAVALAVTAAASWAFWSLEARPGWGWRVPRYLFVAAHLVVGALNVWRVR